MPDFDILPEIITGATADVYFLRTRRVLEAEGLNPVATMEIFSSRAGILCGIAEAVQLLRQQLPSGAQVWAMSEGDPMDAREVVLRITAPYNSYGIYETAILGMLASDTGWATAARECVDAAAGIPVISFGARHVHPRVAPIMEYAAVIGGCRACADSRGAELADVPAAGTMPHAMILIFGDTVRAALAFDRHMPPDVPRTVLVDTFKDEVEESLRVAEAMGRRLMSVRLDTPTERGRVTPDLAKELRAKLDLAGFQHVGIFVSGGLDIDRIRLFVESGAPVVGFGVGSYIAAGRPIDFTGDLKEIDGHPVAKRGRLPGLTMNPRLRQVIG